MADGADMYIIQAELRHKKLQSEADAPRGPRGHATDVNKVKQIATGGSKTAGMSGGKQRGKQDKSTFAFFLSLA